MFLTSFISIGLLALTGKNKSNRYENDKQDEILIENEQMFRRLVQTQTAIVWQASPVAFRFLYVSDEAVKLLGYPVDQWINEVDFCKKHIHQDDWKAVLAFREAKSRNQGNKHIEFRMIAMDGRCIWLRSFVQLIEENGKVPGLFGYMVDITMKKRQKNNCGWRQPHLKVCKAS